MWKTRECCPSMRCASGSKSSPVLAGPGVRIHFPPTGRQRRTRSRFNVNAPDRRPIDRRSDRHPSLWRACGYLALHMLDLPLAEAVRLASASPTAFLGVDDWLWHLAPGYRADMVALNPSTVGVLPTWVAGMPAVTA